MKFVIRILDHEKRLLAWGQVEGVCRPGGRVEAAVPSIRMTIEGAGRCASTVIHWTDLDIARELDFMGEADIPEGTQSAEFTFAFGPLWRVPFDPNVPLPPVTVREHIMIGVPVGELGIVSPP